MFQLEHNARMFQPEHYADLITRRAWPTGDSGHPNAGLIPQVRTAPSPMNSDVQN